jgi:arylsulfatase A-like enzyme
LFVPRIPNLIGAFDYTTHGGPWKYLQSVPLVFYGPGFIRSQGSIHPDREITLADISPTVAELLDFDWGKDRPGRPISEVLVPESERPDPPRLILTMVLDGGGTDVLRTWPDAWPNLERLTQEGTALANATVGSAPSVTPPAHTTIGTAAFPEQHGIVDLTQRSGDRVIDSFVSKVADFSPENMMLTTLADDYDQASGNAPKIGLLGYRGWQLGMMSAGAFLPGGDKDAAVLIDRLDGDLITNDAYYSLPGSVADAGDLARDTRTADLTDGKADSKWMGTVDLSDEVRLQYSPAWTLHQTDLMKALLTAEQAGKDAIPDLFFVNYKQIDDVAHFYDMLSSRMEETVEFSDDALGELEAFLDDSVGRGKWVLVLTADHGAAPLAEVTGGWPINVLKVGAAAAKHFGVPYDDLILNERTMGYWFDLDVAKEKGVTAEEFSTFLLNYRIRDAAAAGQEVPDQYLSRLDEPVFAAAFPSEMVPAIWACAKKRS